MSKMKERSKWVEIDILILSLSCFFFFSVQESSTVLKDFLKHTSFSPISDLHACNTRVDISRTGQCLDWRFPLMSFCLRLAHPSAFSNVPQSRLRSRNP